MVMTSTGNDTAFEKIAHAPTEQHPKVHTSERPERTNDRERKPFNKYKYNRQANLGQQDWWQEEYYEEQDDDEDDPEDDAGCYFAGATEEYEVCDTIEEVEEDTFICLLCNGHEDAEEMASICQAETHAFLSWNRTANKGDVKGKGKGKGKRKGKGKGKRPRYSSGMKPGLSLDERKKALNKLKSETKCNDCGEQGHWKGDPGCKQLKTSFLATSLIGSQPDPGHHSSIA